MGKPKKGGFPPNQPSVQDIHIKAGKIQNKTIAWGDSVFWVNEDPTTYTLILLEINGEAVSLPAPVWATLTPVGTPGANSSLTPFNWPGGVPPKTPYVYKYGLREPPNSQALLTVQLFVPLPPAPPVSV